MPKWKLHNKWAEKLGVREEIANFANLLIDFPQLCQEFIDFCEQEPTARIFKKGKATQMNVSSFTKHDSARNKIYDRRIQLEFLLSKGENYITAWYLHQILDYIKWWVEENPSKDKLTVESILTERRLKRKIGNPDEKKLQIIKDFVIKHSEEILEDCRVNP